MEQPPALRAPLHDSLYPLLQALPHKQLCPCAKGRFYEQMQDKLDQLATSATNEVVTMDFADLMRRLAVAAAGPG